MSKISRILTAGLLAAALPFASTQAKAYTAQEKANIKLVEDFYAALDRAALDRGDAAVDIKQKIRGIAERYLAPDYIQHAEAAGAVGQGREGFIRFFEQMPAIPGPPPAGAPQSPPDGAPPSPPAGALNGAPALAKALAIMADGDLVIRVSSRSMPSPGGGAPAASTIFNMFRVQVELF